jgi:hypothetical protein
MGYVSVEGNGLELYVVEVGEAAVVANRATLPQQSQHLDGLVGPGAALGSRYTHGVKLSRELAAYADAHRYPPPRTGVEVGQLLGDHDGLVQR